MTLTTALPRQRALSSKQQNDRSHRLNRDRNRQHFSVSHYCESPWILGESGLSTVLPDRNQPPSWAHPFGTDWLGRDMLRRSLHGLSLSLRVGLLAASVSALIGTGLGLAAGTLGGWVDAIIIWIIDVFFSLPHLVLLILIAFAVGGGTRGVIIAVALTHSTA